jgi:hypothetical protein
MHPLNRAALQDLAEIRLEDARVLLQNQRYAAAYYLAGYVIECALKACIAKQTRQYDFPDKKTVVDSYKHRAGELVGLANLPLEEKLNLDWPFARNWRVVKDWSERSRYDPPGSKLAEDLFRAISDPEHGVLQWLQEYW